MADHAWTVITAGKSGKGASWRHESGWELHHCGHPTALWPYWLQHPDVDAPVFSHNGKGFDSVRAAKVAIELIAAGRVAPSSDRCAPGILRLPGVLASGGIFREAVSA